MISWHDERNERAVAKAGHCPTEDEQIDRQTSGSETDTAHCGLKQTRIET